MRVLLISPLPRLDPACGDVVYTNTLLSDPPEGVVYETYADALASGALVEHYTRDAVRRVGNVGLKFFTEVAGAFFCKLVNLLRRARILFWEPFRIFSVAPGVYDLVHVHVFSCRFKRVDCPVVFSNALPQRYLYTDARGYSDLRVRLTEMAECALARLQRVNLGSYMLPGILRVVAFTEDLRRWYVERSIVAPTAVDVVPVYLSDGTRAQRRAKPRRIGFVAKDFAAKGGQVLLRAFERVREAVPEAELVIVGSKPIDDPSSLEAKGIRWIEFVNRDFLLRELLPSLDVFAYPTLFDGMPLVLLEAMRCGIAIAASSYRAIPEMLEFGKAGLLSPVGDSDALARNLCVLLDPVHNQQYSAMARARFDAAYSSNVVRPKLRAAYLRALERSDGVCVRRRTEERLVASV